jgi:hypothetical protein
MPPTPGSCGLPAPPPTLTADDYKIGSNNDPSAGGVYGPEFFRTVSAVAA